MGLLGDAAMRFVRTKWKSTQTLAEELFATFGGPLDLFPQSVTINQAAGATLPPLVINQPAGTTTPGIQINRGDGTTTTIGGSGADGGADGGGIDLGDITFPGQEPGDIIAATPNPANNPFVLHGVVVGQQAGAVYQVRCYAKNPDVYPAIGLLSVSMAGLNPDDRLPADLRLMVVAFPADVNGLRTIERAIGYPPLFTEPEVS